jgi:hypothetical protein
MSDVVPFTEYYDPPKFNGVHGPQPAVGTIKQFQTISLPALRHLQIPERDMVLLPVVPAKGLTMIFAQRGVGKTHVGIGAAFAVATGTSFLRWKAERPRKVLYVDGEMPAKALQDRINALVEASGGIEPENLRFLAMDMQELGVSVNLAKPEDQAAVEAQLHGAELVVFDNLSTLVSAGRENDAESWDEMQSWLLRLRRKGVSALLIHHAGRGGNARGTSKREDVLDTVISLRHPDDYIPSEGAHFEVHLTKARGIYGDDALPFEAKLETVNGHAIWTTRALPDAEAEQVLDMSQARMSVRDIASEIGISKSKVARIQAKLKEEGRL